VLAIKFVNSLWWTTAIGVFLSMLTLDSLESRPTCMAIDEGGRHGATEATDATIAAESQLDHRSCKDSHSAWLCHPAGEEGGGQQLN